MFKQTQARILFMLLLLAAPLTVCAQSYERFWVVPGDENGLGGDGSLETVFEFTGDVTEAKCYQIVFGDGDGDRGRHRYQNPEKPQDPGGTAFLTHSYTKAGNYSAVMRAWRLRDGDEDREVNCDGDLSELGAPIELSLQITVRRPAPVRRPPPSVPEFSVRRSNASDIGIDGMEPTWADFSFDAFVKEADSYELDFDDGVIESNLMPSSVGQAVSRHHRYQEPGVYTAVMTARRNQADLVRLERQVSVQKPQPVVSAQWPKVRPVRTVRPEATKPDTLPWLLLAAIALLLSQRLGMTRGDPGKFETTTERGTLGVIGSPDAVSMRVRRNEPQIVISDDAVVLGVQPGRPVTRVDS